MAETRCKYYKQKRQVSYDGGATWQDVIPYQYQRGELYEYESADCGAVVVYRWVNMDASVDYYCEGTTKYYKQKKQVSYDGGQTWIDVSPAEYQKGGVAEQQSQDCGYVPPTPQYRWIKSDDTICVEYVPPTPTGNKFVANYYNGTTREVECNSSTELTSGETRPSGFSYRNMANAVIGDCVTTIGEEAFEYCDGLTSVTIPNSVITIGDSAFYMSSRLTSIDIPNSVTSIGMGAFANCSGLTSLNIGNSVTTIGNLAFNHCTGLTSVNIPNSVTSIGENAFDWCTSLTSVTIPNSVTTIGGWAFMYCSGLTSVNIPDSVTSIGMSAFNYCSGLTSITVEATTPPTLEPYVFDNTNNCPIYVPCQSVDAYKSAENWSGYADRIQCIPPTPTGNKLVANYDDSKTLEVDCNGDGTLTSGETQPSGYEKNRMTNAVIGNCVTIIGDNAFYGCGITSVTIPNSVTTIGYHAFSYCSDLTGVTIPNSVTTIGNGAFWHCSGLTSVTIPNSVTEIDIYAFHHCTRLTSVTIGNSVTTIGGHAFQYCSGLTSIVIPDSVTSIGGAAFWECYGLTSVTIGNSVTEIGNMAFQECTHLTSVNIPDSVTTIDENAFNHCTRLTSVTIGNSVTTIGDSAFNHCTGLTSITVEAITPPTIGASTFYETNNCPIYVPCESVAAYRTTSGWSNFVNRIQGIPPCSETSKKLVVTYSDGRTREVECNGSTYLSSGETKPRSYQASAMTNAVIGDCVGTINKHAFSRCSSLTSVTIPDSVATINSYAFYRCSSLTSVTIPNNITGIAEGTFEYCALTSVTIPDSVTYIGLDAFNNCGGLTSITCLAVTPPGLDENVFYNTNNCPIYVPAESVDAYKAAPRWFTYSTRIQPIP